MKLLSTLIKIDDGVIIPLDKIVLFYKYVRDAEHEYWMCKTIACDRYIIKNEGLIKELEATDGASAIKYDQPYDCIEVCECQGMLSAYD